MRNLSVVIITFNEEAQLGRCLNSVKDIADEIVIVDSYSTDRTAEIAASYGAKFITHKFEGHIQQKNWAITQASSPFILSLDADEALDETLRKSILSAKENGNADGYSMNRLNFYCGKAIRSCGWYPDRKLRMWNSRKGSWGGRNPHDKFIMESDVKIEQLQGDILHNTYPTKEAFLQQIEKFAEISAKQLTERSYAYLFFKLLFSPLFKFVKTFFIKGGWKEAATGFFICRMQTKEVWLKYRRAIRYK